MIIHLCSAGLKNLSAAEDVSRVQNRVEAIAAMRSNYPTLTGNSSTGNISRKERNKNNIYIYIGSIVTPGSH